VLITWPFNLEHWAGFSLTQESCVIVAIFNQMTLKIKFTASKCTQFLKFRLLLQHFVMNWFVYVLQFPKIYFHFILTGLLVLSISVDGQDLTLQTSQFPVWGSFISHWVTHIIDVRQRHSVTNMNQWSSSLHDSSFSICHNKS